MTTQQREAFERSYVVPDDASYNATFGEYRYAENFGVTHPFTEVFEAFCDGARWQAAQAQQGEALRQVVFSGWSGCSNHDCIVTGPRTGMGTNGSCGCLMNASRSQLSILKSRLQAVFSAHPQPAQQVKERELLREIVSMWDGPLYRHEMAPLVAKARALLTPTQEQ